MDKIEKIIVGLNQQEIHIKARFLEVPKGTLDGVRMVFATNNHQFQLVGIMTSENAKAFLKTLQSRYGVEELGAPEVTTLSGRQTEMRATITIPTISPRTNMVETGPILDTVATVLPDGHTIDLRAIASLTEFLGYDQPTNTVVKYTATGEK